MEKAGETPTEAEVGRIVFIVYKDSFMVAVSASITEEEVTDVLITALEKIVGKPEGTVLH